MLRKPLCYRSWLKRFCCCCTLVQGHVCGFGRSWSGRSTCKWFSWYTEERRYTYIWKFVSATGVIIDTLSIIPNGKAPSHTLAWMGRVLKNDNCSWIKVTWIKRNYRLCCRPLISCRSRNCLLWTVCQSSTDRVQQGIRKSIYGSTQDSNSQVDVLQGRWKGCELH